MKLFASLVIAVVLLSGCARQKFQTSSIAWFAGYTNLELTITVNTIQTRTNVNTLEQAADILGQYGWQLASVTGDSDANRIMYLKRQYQGNDTCNFSLTPPY